jgi:hypothetical protein
LTLARATDCIHTQSANIRQVAAVKLSLHRAYISGRRAVEPDPNQNIFLPADVSSLMCESGFWRLPPKPITAYPSWTGRPIYLFIMRSYTRMTYKTVREKKYKYKYKYKLAIVFIKKYQVTGEINFHR